MARIFISENSKAFSVVDFGSEGESKVVVLAMDQRTVEAIKQLETERRRLLVERVPPGTSVQGEVVHVEEALLDLIGGIRASGGAEWVRQNFGAN